MLFAFRVDSGVTVGSGHVLRCLALGTEVKSRGHEILFLCRNLENNIIELIQQSGFRVCILSYNSTGDIGLEKSDFWAVKVALGNLVPSWFVVDNYDLGKVWEGLIKEEYKSRILVVDDLPSRRHHCDIILDQNYHAEGADLYSNLIPESTIRLYGTKFVLTKVSDRVPDFTRNAPRDGVIKRVLVYFGSVDSQNNTMKALLALERIIQDADLWVDVVIGNMNRHSSEISIYCSRIKNFIVHATLPSLARLMQDCDLMLSAGGSVIWERCLSGLPGVCVHCSDNQRMSSELMHKNGIHIHLGNGADVDVSIWEVAVRERIKNVDSNKLMSDRSMFLCDGRGAARVASIMLELN